MNNRFKDLLSDQSFTGEINYQYDVLGRKVSKELLPAEGSKKEREYYLYNGLGADILSEYQDEIGSSFSRGRNPSQVREYYYGNGMLLAQKLYLPDGIGDPHHRLSWTNATLDLICYSQDALGSVTLITGQGSKVLGKYRYDAYGNAYNGRFEGCVFGEDEFDNFWDWDENESVAANSATASSDGFTAQGWDGHGNGYGWGHYKHGRSWGILRQGNVYGFTGQRFEPELGVYSFSFRDYNPRTMRWMTEDPVKDGSNWYQYCGGDPVNWVDPDGLYWGSVHGKLTRDAAAAVGITDKDVVTEMVSSNVSTDYQDNRNECGYDWGWHYDNPVTPEDERDKFADQELQKAIDEQKLINEYKDYMPDEAVDSIQKDVYGHLGTGLHSIQDEGSHQGLGAWNVSHTIARDWFGYDVDDPKNNPEAYEKVLEKSKEYLEEFKKATCNNN